MLLPALWSRFHYLHEAVILVVKQFCLLLRHTLVIGPDILHIAKLTLTP